MPFPEPIKDEAKRKARYCCVWCKQMMIPIEVHHIIREADDGPNTLDNAVALCPTHHNTVWA